MDDRVAYLRQPGFSRLWQLARSKYQRMGRVGGSIRLHDLTDEEREALEGLLSINMLGRTELSLPLKTLEQALQATKFRLTLTDALQLALEEALETRQDRLERERRSWEAFCQWSLRVAKVPEVVRWIERLQSGKTSGYKSYLECYEQYREQGECLDWQLAVRALEQLPADQERIPVFAARVVGDPHALDRSRLTGRLFFWGLEAWLQPDEFGDGPENLWSGAGNMDDVATEENEDTGNHAEKIRAYYSKVGLVMDDVSSMVTVAGWPGLSLGMDPVALPLMTVRSIVNQLAPVSDVYVVENPSAFGVLADYWRREGKAAPSPLILTSGQPSLAALCLLDAAVRMGARLHYSGDFDLKGVEMAVSLWKRYREAFVPWEMDTEAYESVEHPHLPSFSEAEVRRLERIQVHWDHRLIGAMMRRRKKVFQEQIVDRLLAEMEGIG